MGHACINCMTVEANAGNCSTCDEQLLDASRASVKELMQAKEERLHERRTKLARWIAVPITFAVFVGSYYIFSLLNNALPSWLQIEKGDWSFELSLVVALIVGVAISSGIPRVFPGKKFWPGKLK